MHIPDRIKELRRVPAGQLRPNPRNWRTHPTAQRDAMRGVLAEIGYADALLARELEDGALELIDGHLRAEITPDAVVPVLVLDLSQAEADMLLATHDPLAAMAGRDDNVLADLLADVETQNAAVRSMLQELASLESLDAMAPAPEAKPEIDIPDTFQVLVDCRDESDQRAVYEQLTRQGYACRVLTI